MAKAKTTNTSKKTTPAPKKRAVNAVTSAKKTPLENTKKYRELYENEQRATLELTLINNLTRAVLESQDLEQVLLELAANLAKLLQADDCYITRWDSKNNIPIPQATTAKLKTPFSYIPRPDEISMTASALDAGHALMAEDVFNSPALAENRPPKVRPLREVYRNRRTRTNSNARRVVPLRGLSCLDHSSWDARQQRPPRA